MRVHELSSGSPRKRILGASVVVLAAVGGVGLGIAAVGAANATQEPDVDAVEVVDELADAASAEDILPTDIDLESMDDSIEDSSIRLVGEDQTSSYWMTTNEDGDICLITDFVQGVSAMACADPAVLQEKGMSWSLAGDPKAEGYRAIVALVLPDSAETDDIEVRSATSGAELSGRAADAEVSSTWTEVSPNLLVADAADVDPALEFVIPQNTAEAPDGASDAKISYAFDPASVPQL